MKPLGSGRSDFAGMTEAAWPARAEHAIRLALAAFEDGPSAAEQLDDLADAVEAFADRKYYAAAVLADAALTRRHVERARRPARLERSVRELKEMFRCAAAGRRTPPGGEP